MADPRRPSVVPLALVVVLVIVVALAATRGGPSGPSLAAVGGDGEGTTAVDAAGQPETTAEGAVPRGGEGEPVVGGTTPGAPPDDGAQVLGTEAEPTVRVEDLPMSGTGEFLYADGGRRGWGARPYRRFAVAVEDGAGVDVDELATFVDTVLSDRRSWIGDGVTGFRRVGPGEPVDFTIVVATPDTVDELCFPLDTGGRYSCGANGWIALNLHRWMTATTEWPSTLDVYRHYLINHEVGHYVLGPDHPTCPEPGALAPIMMQQTIDLGGCLPNGWVY